MAPKVGAKAAGKPAAKAKAPSAAAPKKPAAGTKAKAGPAGAKKGAAGKKPAAKKPQWTPEQVAAGTKIQAQMRGFLGRKHYRENKEKKKMMDEELDKLRQQAFVAEVQYERRQEEKKRKKRAEETARKKKETKLKKDMLEAAFDGEDADLKKLMAEAEDIMDNVVDVADGHGNTLLSEASAGGTAATVKHLLKMGANPNTQGEFKRTPLWRAAFLGKADCIAPLLEGGADPRVGNESGELPLHVGNPAIKEVLQAWDVSATDNLVAQFEAMQLEREAQKAAKKRKEINDAQNDMEAAVESHERAQKDLKKARQELERLIYEFDTLVGECKPQTIIEVAKNAIKDQEAKLETATQTARDASERLQNARLAFREMNTGEEGEADLPGQLINLKDLDDVLVKDVGDRILSTGKWPAIIDVSSQASVFLRYMDSNYVNCLNMNQIEPNKLRRSVLGSIRYGKPCVIDIMDVEMWDELTKIFDAVQPGLLTRLLNKSILEFQAYLQLVRPGDGEEYEPNQFQESRIKNFKFVLLTSARNPDQRIVDSFHAIRIRVEK